MSKPTWTTAQGQVLTPDQMTRDHAKNCFNVLVRRYGDTGARTMEIGDALHMRAFGVHAIRDDEISHLFKTYMRLGLKALYGRVDDCGCAKGC